MKEQNVVVTMLLEEKRNKLASILQDARVQKGYTQEYLADIIGCQRQTIQKIEQSRYSPNCDILYLLSEALEIDLIINNQKI